MKIEDKRFLIIAGQPKAGTTSLFEWIRQHPMVCASRLKEARFFLDELYPLRRPLSFNGDNLVAYLDLFDFREREVLLEASPDYLYCENPLRIATLLPMAKVVVVFREPVARMISAYRFFQQRGLLDPDMSFDQYVLFQAENAVRPDTPVQFRALDHCRLDFYLDRWRSAFGERLLVLDFDDLRERPVELIERGFKFIDLEVDESRQYSLSSENKTFRSRWPMVSRLYYAANREASMLAMRMPFLKHLLAPANRLLKRVIQSKQPVAAVTPSAEARQIILDWASGKK